jgi:uncharacterized protein YecE (DUF72 family)
VHDLPMHASNRHPAWQDTGRTEGAEAMTSRKTGTGDMFAHSPAPGSSIRTGMGGWTFAPWRSNFYPEGLVQRRELEYASRHVSAIEINGTYYGAQKPATYAKWAAETPDGFVFSLKAPRYVVESKKLGGARAGIEGFVFGGIGEMGDRLGPVLWQLAPSRRFDADDIAAFLDLLPRELNGRPLRHVLEVRNDSFMCDEYLALARRHRVPTVFTDSPDYPSFADLTGDFAYARLMRSHADKPTGYSALELERWANRAKAWAAGKDPIDLPHAAAALPDGSPRDVFIYFISAAKERNPAAAMGLMKKL